MALAITVVFVPIVLIPATPAAAANPATSFELDGNGFVDPATAPAAFDWSCYFGTLQPDGTPGSDPNCAGAPAPITSSGLITDPFDKAPDNTFTQVKDKDQISGCANSSDCWEWKIGGANPAKNDLEHGGVLSFQNGDSTIAYFMADRFKNEGSAFLGFWFFRSPVTQNPIVPPATVGTFSGTHTTHNYTTGALGDILVLANFDPNNDIGAITTAVFEWDVTCTNKDTPTVACADTNLRTLQPEAESNCLTSSGPVCAVFNTTQPIPTPWPFLSSDNKIAPNNWETTLFTEGGIDLTQILGGDDCVTSFVVETRTSESVDAELTDFISGDINTCGKITIVKQATPEDGTDFGFTATKPPSETKVPATFTLDDDANATLSNTVVFDNIRPGAYSFTENAVSGWDLTNLSCSATTGSSAVPNVPGGSVSITLARGGEVTCTFSNSKAPRLKLVKTVTLGDGGDAVPNDWDLTASGGIDGFTESTPASNQATFHEVTAGVTYELNEDGPDGYAAGDWSCDGGTQNGDEITLGAGQDVTCTINNDDIAPQLKLVKVVDNGDGGDAEANDWDLTATGDGGFTEQDPDGTTATARNVKAGVVYTLTEDGPTGYTASEWDCDGGDQLDNTIELGLGDSVTCTITNDDIAPTLKLVKTVTNDDGGNAVANDWDLTATGNGGFTENDPDGTTAQAQTVKANVSYALSEDGPDGYAAGDWICSGGGVQNGNMITLEVDEDATCTINNDDIAPDLTLIKTLTQDDGGTAEANDWALTATGDGGFTENSPDESTATARDVKAGVAYGLSEDGPDGYTAGNWNCTGGGTQVGDTIELALAESVVCRINNNDNTAHLTLIKVVVNDDGGEAVEADFTLSASGPTPISGAGGADSDVDAGTYTLSETSVPGYEASDWACVGGLQNGNVVALALGESATCTIYNRDIPPELKLVKTVKNDNGGTKVANDWDLTAAGGGGFTELTPAAADATFRDVTAGVAYTLSESTVAGYTAGDWVCTGGGTQVGDTIELVLAESVTCTIENDDIAPTLHLRKVVINDHGGTKTVADFTLTADGIKAGNDLTGASPVDSGATLKADTWTLSETAVYGYTASAWVCEGGTQDGNKITVGIGGQATCTITNDDQPGKIVVIKNAKPAQGSFAFTTTGTGYNGFTLTGSTASNGNRNEQTLAAGSYTVKESTQLGWILTGIGGSSNPDTPYNCTVTGSGGSTGVGDLNTQTASITLKNGDTVTCVFENTGQGVTRTQGFWATHPQLAQIAWFGGSAFGHTFPGVINTPGIGDQLICGRNLDTLGKVTGAFWSDIAKTTTGAKRSAIDQARMQLLQQLIAAELNASAFGSVPSGGTGAFAQWEAALCGTNQNAIKTAQQQAASFNSNGDTGTFTPGTSADSKTARGIADKVFWNIIKP